MDDLDDLLEDEFELFGALSLRRVAPRMVLAAWAQMSSRLNRYIGFNAVSMPESDGGTCVVFAGAPAPPQAKRPLTEIQPHQSLQAYSNSGGLLLHHKDQLLRV